VYHEPLFDPWTWRCRAHQTYVCPDCTIAEADDDKVTAEAAAAEAEHAQKHFLDGMEIKRLNAENDTLRSTLARTQRSRQGIIDKIRYWQRVGRSAR
jgi:hypothetical protein